MALKSKIHDLTKKMKEAFASKFVDKWLCITTDVWSEKCRSFLGITAHFINDQLERESSLCTSFSMPKFKRTELEFLEEYVSALKPIAIALDMLQGDRGNDSDPTSKPGRTFMSTLVPHI